MATDTIFYKISKGEVKSSKVYEDDYCFAFDDTNPQAPVHVIVIPKYPTSGLSDLGDDASKFKQACGHILSKANDIAKLKGCDENGYRVVINKGVHGQQTVKYLHFHIIGGRQMNWPPG